MHAARLLAVWFAYFSACACASAADIVLRCPVAAEVNVPRVVSIDQGLHLLSATTESIVVEVNEFGEQLVAAEESSAWHAVTVPLRYGLHVALLGPGERTSLRSARPARAGTKARLTVHCQPMSDDDTLLAWFARAAALSAEIYRTVGSVPASQLIGEAERLVDTALPGRDRALAVHLLAQAHLDAGASAVGSRIFGEAEDAWSAIGDTERALVARLARIEDLSRTARHVQVLEMLSDMQSADVGDSYVLLRIRNSACLALLTLGRREEARDCYRPNAQRLEELNEPLERAVTLIALGHIERDLGNFPLARSLAMEALAVPDEYGSETVRGRAHTLLADVAVREGRPGVALQSLGNALAAHERSGDLRAQANILLRIADLYRLLMAWNEAYESIALGLRLLSPVDAPERVAAGLLGLARLDLDAGRTELAWTNAGRAQSLFERLGLAERAYEASLVRREAALALGRPEPTASMSAPPTTLASRAALVAALEAQHRGAHADALGFLDRPPARQSVDDAVQWRIARARSHAAQPEGTEAALEELSTAAALLAAAAGGSGNAVLRTLVLRRLDRVRIEGVQLLAGPSRVAGGQWSEVPSDRSTLLRRWALGRAGAPPRPGEALGERAVAFDRALARELLGVPGAPSPDTPGALRLALSALSPDASPVVHDAAAAWEPAEVPPTDPGIAYLLPYTQDHRLTVVLFVGDRVWTRDGGDARALAADVGALRSSLSQPSHADPESLAASLSARLLGVDAPIEVPGRLAVVESPTFAVLPWALLRWPGDRRSLVETTDIALFDPGAPGSSTVDRDAEVRVLVASLHGAQGGVLPPLENARSIGRRFRTLWSQEPAGLAIVDPAGRDDLLAALERPGVVHVAAHGTTQPGRLGSSGLWLQDAARATPEFVGWFDVVSRPLAAGLLVLDACRTADDGGDPNAPGLAFANTAHRAGVGGVVSALWPVSDSASGVWLPAFYRSYSGAGSARDVAASIRQAQLALRATRAYRHPFYWASLVYLGRFEARSRAAEVAPRRAAPGVPNA
ncbi:MAG: CHAT domain-containing protein [Xanthomonadaceae bacterium]|jgi:tetratricopeptide (TPR) repeat protein|nr:CHAT domain-containing protein [Xanthomonadaceae bacterium]